MKLYESGEMYLETILILQNRNGHVRSIDIANELKYSKPSVSRAVNILKNASYIIIEPDGNISFTEKGSQTANAIYERHLLITKYLMMTLGIDEDTASADACRIEHILSNESFAKIKELTNHVEAFRESDSDYSMANQVMTEAANISVSDKGIYATIVMHGTEEMPMSSVKSLNYSYDGFSFKSVDTVLDPFEDTLTINLPIIDLNNPVFIEVYVPGKMGDIHPKFRLVFKIDAIVEK